MEVNKFWPNHYLQFFYAIELISKIAVFFGLIRQVEQNFIITSEWFVIEIRTTSPSFICL